MSFNTLINVFPQFGMYSNACGVSEWTYTGVKHYEKVSFINSQIIFSIIALTPRFAVVAENTRTVEPIWDESKKRLSSKANLSQKINIDCRLMLFRWTPVELTDFIEHL